MASIDPRDKLPLVSAAVVMALGNIIGDAVGTTIYLTILAGPVAVLAFGAVRYFLHGSPYPESMRQ